MQVVWLTSLARFEDFLTNMRLLPEEKIDCLAIVRRDGKRMIKKLGVQGKVVLPPWSAAVNTLHYVFSRSSPCFHLLDRFNEELVKRIGIGALDTPIIDYDTVPGAGQ